MKQPIIFVQDPNALKNWLRACGTHAKVIYGLDNLASRFEPQNTILLCQLANKSIAKQLILLAKDFDVIAFANKTNDFEGLQLFQAGVKGYLNTFATQERIEQALQTVAAGNVWLGQSVMQALIQSVSIEPSQNSKDDWKNLVTEREQQTIEQVLLGKNNKQIAEELNITQRTVKSHLHNVFEKLEVTDRLALVLKINHWQASP